MLTQLPIRLLRPVALVSLLAAAACSSRSNPSPAAPAPVGGNGAADPPPATSPPLADAGTPAPDGGSAAPDGGSPPVTQSLPHHRCGWIGADSAAVGTASFVANAAFFDAIHPVWYTAQADGTLRAIAGFTDDATIVSTARANHVALMPLVYGGDDAATVRTILASPAAISAHVAVLAKLAVDKGYDGIELDYEHLWSAGDRPGFTALVTQLAAALHKSGKTLSAAVSPASSDYAGSAYDLPGMVKAGVDVLHLMGYDYHWLGGDHLGPLAPIGWIDASAAYLQAKGIADHAILGVANYGVGNGWYADTADVLSQCLAGTLLATTNHMASCPYGTSAAGVAPHCTTARGDVWFEDKDSVAEKAQVAKKHGLRGITYYTLGGEPPGFFDAIRASYP